jgi:hypothetical protein
MAQWPGSVGRRNPPEDGLRWQVPVGRSNTPGRCDETSKKISGQDVLFESDRVGSPHTAETQHGHGSKRARRRAYASKLIGRNDAYLSERLM